ncbi:PREDICTED: isoflavone 2'-hydroxylase [Theobroma cacao]|uniref:Isoflavone 2'-hydroxylase n=1 Tax=Theobroma cacao TaxID=3641 RepID=A0AB32UVD9_THECC|nr:PREDICTED: isoflavone 2'-hydroxylase [Theobroma cacao]
MEVSYYLVLVTSFLFLIHKLFIRNRVVRRNLPPSPPGLPIIGHYHLLKRPVHLTLHDLSKKKIAEYDFTTLVTCPYGHHWRNLRRLTAIEIFSSARIQGTSSIRAEEIHFLVKQLFKSSFREVEIESFFYILTFNIMMKLVAGHRYLDDDVHSDNNRGMINDLKQMFNPTVNLSWSDHFPILRWLTFQGADKRILKTHVEKDDFLQALVDMRRRVVSSPSITDGERKRPIIDVMLSLQESEPDCYTDEIIKGIIMVKPREICFHLLEMICIFCKYELVVSCIYVLEISIPTEFARI